MLPSWLQAALVLMTCCGGRRVDRQGGCFDPFCGVVPVVKTKEDSLGLLALAISCRLNRQNVGMALLMLLFVQHER